jgi:hypothetical protein
MKFAAFLERFTALAMLTFVIPLSLTVILGFWGVLDMSRAFAIAFAFIWLYTVAAVINIVTEVYLRRKLWRLFDSHKRFSPEAPAEVVSRARGAALGIAGFREEDLIVKFVRHTWKDHRRFDDRVFLQALRSNLS